MGLQQGPRKIEKLATGCKIANFETGSTESTLLISSPQQKLESFYIKSSIHPGVQTKLLPIKSLDICSVPSLFSFSGKKNIVHCFQQTLVINNKREVKQKGAINHLLVDDAQIALTTCLDTITLNSVEKGVQMAELHYYGSNISAIFWNNSLVISGDERGTTNLWDINKQKVLHTTSIYTSPIDFIGSYVDFIHTNFYYTVSKTQKKIAFYDLRNYKPIKITSNLPSELIRVNHNQSGKIFMQTTKNIEVIDLYQGYNILGAFNDVKEQKLDDFLIKYPEGKMPNRQLTDLLIWDKYVVAGCSNGCIQVYNTDTFECMYAYGLCQFSGIEKLKRVDNALLALEQKGILSMIQFV